MGQKCPPAVHTEGVIDVARRVICLHEPACPAADACDCEAAHTVATHPEQGWSLLCNGVLLFEDTGGLLPNGVVIAPHRPTDIRAERFLHLSS